MDLLSIKNQAGPAQDPWPPKPKPSRPGPGPLAPQAEQGFKECQTNKASNNFRIG